MSVSGHKSCTSTCYKCLYWQRAFSSLRLRKRPTQRAAQEDGSGLRCPQKADLTCFDLGTSIELDVVMRLGISPSQVERTALRATVLA